jgi:ribosomal protein L5
MGCLKLFQWLLFQFNMYYSSYEYYNATVIRRLLLQKHGRSPLQVSSITLEVSNTALSSVEDPEVVNSLKALEVISGRKASLSASGSRYVGTSKRAFFSAFVNLRKNRMYSFLLVLALFFLPNYQKLGGRYTRQWVKHGSFTICCKDLQLFDSCFSPSLKSNLRIFIKSEGTDDFSFLDLLQCFKFNII